MINDNSGSAVEYHSQNVVRGTGPIPESYQERPGGVIVVAIVLTLAIVVNIVLSFRTIGKLSHDEYLFSRSTINATRGILWANILLSLPVFVFIAGLFGKGAWARGGLISYLCCNSIFLLISLFATSLSYQWISLLCDIAIVIYLARDGVGDAYANDSGMGWGIASGIGLVGAQVIIILLILHAVS
jgi:hypothetical protein